MFCHFDMKTTLNFFFILLFLFACKNEPVDTISDLSTERDTLPQLEEEYDVEIFK